MTELHIGPTFRAMRHNRTRVLLIVFEIAITLAIVSNCVSVILGERARMSQQSGFADDEIVNLHVRPFSPEFRDEGFLRTTIDEDLRTIESVPGVQAAANTSFALWHGGGSSTRFYVPGTSRPPVTTQVYRATRDIAEALGTPMVAGRPFETGDHVTGADASEPTRVIITQSLAEMLFPGGNAVGQTIQQGEPGRTFDPPVVVVGVSGPFFNPFGRGTQLAAHSNRAAFLASRVGDYDGGFSYLVRTRPGTMSRAIDQIERDLLARNAGRVLEFEPVLAKRTRWFASSSIVVTTMSCIIVALVAVTALGLLGLTSLSVTERRRQIGTRRALGATRGAIVMHLLAENLMITTAGLVIGVGAAFALNVVLVNQVADVKLEWPLVAAGVVLLWLNALIATLPPALRAMLVPPSVATRTI